MQTRTLSGRLRRASYDAAGQRLELEFADRSVRCFKGVPAEVFNRLVAAPNPATYFEDRIAEEYPSERGTAAVGVDDARRKLDDLFGS